MEKEIKCDVLVIGAGMAGMAASLFAANRNLSVVQAGVTGEMIYASGVFDLLGVYDLERGSRCQDPWQGIKALCQIMPSHPYAKLKPSQIHEALVEFLALFDNTHIPYRTDMVQNHHAITTIGTIKSTFALPLSMWEAHDAICNQIPGVIVDFSGLKGFSASQIKENLGKFWPHLKAVRVCFPGTDGKTELYPEHMARMLDVPDNKNNLIQTIKPIIGDAGILGLPAVLGMYRTQDIINEMEHELGVRIFEIPTMPPTIPGLRLREFFEKEIVSKGVNAFYQQRVSDVSIDPDKSFSIKLKAHDSECLIHAQNAILASGRFIGQGLKAARKGIVETVFNLPVYQPLKRKAWYQMDLFDLKGHAVNQTGIETDEYFRPTDNRGKLVYKNLFAVGSILAHQDWMRMKCGVGLAVATAFGAVNHIASKVAVKNHP